MQKMTFGSWQMLKKTAFLAFPCYYNNGGFKTTAVRGRGRGRGSEGN